MAELIYLDYKAEPPENEAYVLVQRNLHGLYNVATTGGGPGAVLLKGPFERLGDAVEYAQLQADRNNIASIYTKGVPLA